MGVMDLEEFLSEWKKEIEETNRPATKVKSGSSEPSILLILNSGVFSMMYNDPSSNTHNMLVL